MLKSEVQCHNCDDSFSTIPSLKRHLEEHFAKYKQEHLPPKRKSQTDMERDSKRKRTTVTDATLEVSDGKTRSTDDEETESP